MTTILGYDAMVVLVYYSAMSVLSLFGIVGNVISIVVWTRPQLKSSSAVLLTALGFSDTLLLLSTFPYKFLATLVKWATLSNVHSEFLTNVNRFILPFMVVYGYPCYAIVRTISLYLTVAMTVERYIAVCFPFEYQDICSYGRTCKTTVAIIIFTIIYNSVTFWRTDIHATTEPDGTVIRFHYTVNQMYAEKVLVWLDLFFIYLIPLSVIMICNTTICYKLKMGRRTRQGITDHEKKENRLSMMLVYVVFEFFICSSVTAFVAIDNTFNLTPSSLWDRAKMVPVENFFDQLNASINFVTYVTFGKPFRKTFVDKFCSCYKNQSQERDHENNK